MKFFTLAILLTFCLGSHAQTTVKLPLADSNVEYSGLVNLSNPAYSKSKLFNLAHTWFASTFKNSNTAIKVLDKDNGTIMARGNVLYTPANQWEQTPNIYLTFYVQVDVKDGKYRYKFYDMGFSGTTEINLSAEYRTYLSGNVVKNLFESKKKAMKQYEADFIFVDKTINGLAAGLKAKMAEIKTDNF